MSRIWKQYDRASDSWVVWPANTWPSAESVFKAAFLNQFVAWSRYLQTLYNSNIYLADYVQIGDNLQNHYTWRKLLGGYLQKVLGATYNTPIDHELNTELDDPEKLLYHDPRYQAALEPEDGLWPNPGDIIQPRNEGCRIRTSLMNARTRYDLMINYEISTVSGNTQLDRWRYSEEYPWENEHTVISPYNTGNGLYCNRRDWGYDGKTVEFTQVRGIDPYMKRAWGADQTASCWATFGYTTYEASSYNGIKLFDAHDMPKYIVTDIVPEWNTPTHQLFSGTRYMLDEPDYPPLNVQTDEFFYLWWIPYIHPHDVLPAQFTPAEYPFPT